MSAKHDNQHTTPPFTEQEAIERFKALVPASHGGPDQHDWVKLFLGYVRSTQSEVKSLKSYLKANGVAYAAVQTRGGAMFWNRSRVAIQSAALAHAVKTSPETVAVKYEKQLRIISKLEDAVEHRVDAIRKGQLDSAADPVNNPPNPFEITAIEKLIQSIDTLAKTNVLLDSDGIQKHEHKVVELHALMIRAVAERDAELGVGE